MKTVIEKEHRCVFFFIFLSFLFILVLRRAVEREILIKKIKKRIEKRKENLNFFCSYITFYPYLIFGGVQVSVYVYL